MGRSETFGVFLAAVLGISRKSLWEKMRKLGLQAGGDCVQ